MSHEGYLLDTNVLSAILRHERSSFVDRQLDMIPQHLAFVSAISMGEIQKGIALLPQGRRRRALEVWFEELKEFYASQMLPVDLETAITWGKISASTRRDGSNIAAADLLIAATALQHGLTVITRNVRDVIPTGVTVLDPWDRANSENS